MVKVKTAGKMHRKSLRICVAGAGVADKQLHEADELGNEENEGEDNKSERGVTKNFTDDIAVQYAHDANGECNTRLSETGAG